MSFSHSLVFLFLTVPVVLVWSVLTRRANVVVPFDHRAHPRRSVMSAVLRGFDLLPLALLAIAVAVLAGPKSPQQPRDVRKLTNIQICFDVSGSMKGERYERAASAVEEFTRLREGDAFGLTIFGVEQVRWVPLTKDLNAVRNALPFANPAHQPDHMQGTHIAAALRFVRRNIEREATRADEDRMIILVSDGDSADLGGTVPYELAKDLRESRIKVYLVHVAEGPINEETATICRETGGEAFRAHDPAGLATVFAHIDRLNLAEKAPRVAVDADYFRPFALAALGAIGMLVLGLFGVRYTPW